MPLKAQPCFVLTYYKRTKKRFATKTLRHKGHIYYLDRIYRINGIFSRLRRAKCPSAEGPSIQTIL
jgi:hypothetical protein